MPQCQQAKVLLSQIKIMKTELTSVLLDREDIVLRNRVERAKLLDAEYSIQDIIKELKRLTEIDIVALEEEAKKILGDDHVLGRQAVNRAFNAEFEPEIVPPIPFTRKELKYARDQGLFLVWRIDLAWTIQFMREFIERKIDSKGRIRLIQINQNTEWLKKQPFYTESIVRPGWALVSKGPLKNSMAKGKNFIDLIDMLADYAEELIPHLRPSKRDQFRQALIEFNQYWDEQFGGLTRAEYNVKIREQTFRTKYIREIIKLRLIKLLLNKPVEFVYDIILLRNQGIDNVFRDDRLVLDQITYASDFTTASKVIKLSSFGEDGIYLRSTDNIADHDDSLGIAPSIYLE